MMVGGLQRLFVLGDKRLAVVTTSKGAITLKLELAIEYGSGAFRPKGWELIIG